MKLSAHRDHEDYHPVAHYITVLINGKCKLDHVISFNTDTGEYSQYVYPFNIIDGELEIQYKQDDSLDFEVTQNDNNPHIIQDWCHREINRRRMSSDSI